MFLCIIVSFRYYNDFILISKALELTFDCTERECIILAHAFI